MVNYERMDDVTNHNRKPRELSHTPGATEFGCLHALATYLTYFRYILVHLTQQDSV